jgi:hypothetical protein
VVRPSGGALPSTSPTNPDVSGSVGYGTNFQADPAGATVFQFIVQNYNVAATAGQDWVQVDDPFSIPNFTNSVVASSTLSQYIGNGTFSFDGTFENGQFVQPFATRGEIQASFTETAWSGDMILKYTYTEVPEPASGLLLLAVTPLLRRCRNRGSR